MKMTAAVQEKSGPATDEAIKRFNLDSSVSPALESGWWCDVIHFLEEVWSSLRDPVWLC